MKYGYDLHLAFYAGDEYLGGTMGNVVTPELARLGKNRTFRAAEKTIEKWLASSRYAGCDISMARVKLYLGDDRWDLVFYPGPSSHGIKVDGKMVPVAWKLFVAPAPCENAGVLDEEIPF